MAFSNAKKILTIGSASGSLKLLLATASFTRPRYRAISLGLLRPFVSDGELPIRYQCYGRRLTMFLRTPKLLSDLQGALSSLRTTRIILTLTSGPIS